MENKGFVFSFKDEESAKKFSDYVKKIEADKELNQKIEKAESKEQAYKLLKERNLINMDFQEFISALDQTCEKMAAACDKANGELSIEELESIVGGGIFSKSWWKKNWKKAMSFVPITGDLTVAISDIASGEVKGKHDITCSIILGLGGKKVLKAGEIIDKLFIDHETFAPKTKGIN